ncbi:MAG: hypothetical protein V4792_16470 [Pseudomonadota bacterium]
MRPRGEIREALASAVTELLFRSSECTAFANPGVTWRDAALRAQVGFDAARQTMRNMARDGELVPVGTARVDHACRPMVLYAPASEAMRCAAATLELSHAIDSWAAFP